MKDRIPFPVAWLHRLACLALAALVWLLLERPLLRLPGLGELSWRQIWPQGMPLIEISLAMTAVAVLLGWGRAMSFFLGAVFLSAAFTGVKIQDNIKRATTEIHDPALALAVRGTIDETVITAAGYAQVAALITLLILSFRIPLGNEKNGEKSDSGTSAIPDLNTL